MDTKTSVVIEWDFRTNLGKKTFCLFVRFFLFVCYVSLGFSTPPPCLGLENG